MTSMISIGRRKPAMVNAGTVIHATAQFGVGVAVFIVHPDHTKDFVPLTKEGDFVPEANITYKIKPAVNDEKLKKKNGKLRRKAKKLKRELEEATRERAVLLDEIERLKASKKDKKGFWSRRTSDHHDELNDRIEIPGASRKPFLSNEDF